MPSLTSPSLHLPIPPSPSLLTPPTGANDKRGRGEGQPQPEATAVQVAATTLLSLGTAREWPSTHRPLDTPAEAAWVLVQASQADHDAGQVARAARTLASIRAEEQQPAMKVRYMNCHGKRIRVSAPRHDARWSLPALQSASVHRVDKGKARQVDDDDHLATLEGEASCPRCRIAYMGDDRSREVAGPAGGDADSGYDTEPLDDDARDDVETRRWGAAKYDSSRYAKEFAFGETGERRVRFRATVEYDSVVDLAGPDTGAGRGVDAPVVDLPVFDPSDASTHGTVVDWIREGRYITGAPVRKEIPGLDTSKDIPVPMEEALKSDYVTTRTFSWRRSAPLGEGEEGKETWQRAVGAEREWKRMFPDKEVAERQKKVERGVGKVEEEEEGTAPAAPKWKKRKADTWAAQDRGEQGDAPPVAPKGKKRKAHASTAQVRQEGRTAGGKSSPRPSFGMTPPTEAPTLAPKGKKRKVDNSGARQAAVAGRATGAKAFDPLYDVSPQPEGATKKKRFFGE